MKTTITILAILLISVSSFAQGRGMNYKAVVKDASGNIIASQTIDLRFNIVTSSDTSVYAESHTTTTDANGIIIVSIGGGTIISGSFFSINWENDLYGLQTEVDPEQDGSFVDLGITQFKAVPYAYSSMDNLWQLNDDNAIALGEKIGIGTNTPTQLLSLKNPDNASIKLEAASTTDTTGIRLENGEKTGFYTHYKIDNYSDRLRISIDSDLTTTSTDYEEILNISSNGNINTDGNINSDGFLSAENGTSINEFSTDGTLAGNSNDVVPTEAAVKAYVDNAIPTTSKSIMIPAAAFNSNADSFVYRGRYAQNTSGNSPLYAPVIIPAGSLITNIEAVFLDTSSSENLNLSIQRNNNISNSTIFITSMSSSGSSSNPQIVSTPTNIGVVSNTQFFMYVTSSPNWPDIFDYGILMVKITYTE